MGWKNGVEFWLRTVKHRIALHKPVVSWIFRCLEVEILEGSVFLFRHLRLPAEDEEYIWGGGEQFTYLNLREGGTYPIWVREGGVGRNKSSLLTQVPLTEILLLFRAISFSKDNGFKWSRRRLPHHILASAFVFVLSRLPFWPRISSLFRIEIDRQRQSNVEDRHVCNFR